MGKVNIERIKRRGGSLIEYFCVFNMSKEEFTKGTNGDMQFSARHLTPKAELEYKSQWWDGPRTIEPIKNGEAISVELENDINKMFVWTDTVSGELFSDEIEVIASKTYSIKTKTGLFSLKLIVSES